MTSFQITISPTRRAAARFIASVRRAIQEALVEEYKARGFTQSDIARVLNVHRSVINREIRGEKDLTLGRIAELAHALGRHPTFSLPKKKDRVGANAISNQAQHGSASSGHVDIWNTSPSPKAFPARATFRPLEAV